jgi:hypothetical protein
MHTAMTYAHSHKAVTTYTAFLESDESPTSTSCEASTLVAMKLAESSNIEILLRSVDYREKVGVVQMWSDMYRDRGEYIRT